MRLSQRYLAQDIVSSILLMMLALLALFAFFSLIQEIEHLGKGSYGLGKMLLFVLLSLPGHVYEVMPVAVLVGTMQSIGQFARHNELLALRVFGLSLRALALLFINIGLIFTVLTFLVGEFLTPVSEHAAQRLHRQATQSVVVQELRSGLWAKDGNDFINVEQVLTDANLQHIRIFQFAPVFQLNTIITAQRAQFENHAWQLYEVTQTVIRQHRVHIEHLPKLTWTSSLRPELLNFLLILPEKMSTWSLLSYIGHLRENKQNTSRYEMALTAKLVYPLACVMMMLLAMPFGFLQQRASGVNNKLAMGIMLGVVYQILNRVFGHLGLLNDWPPFLSIITPTLIFLTIAVGLCYAVERR